MKHIRTALYITLLLIGAAAMSGCGTLSALDGKFENRVACTVAKDKLFVISEYGPIGISGKIAEADRAVICR